MKLQFFFWLMDFLMLLVSICLMFVLRKVKKLRYKWPHHE